MSQLVSRLRSPVTCGRRCIPGRGVARCAVRHRSGRRDWPPAAGLIELRVNGDIKQRADISQLIHTVPDIIAHLSSFYHLHPGDLIYTGTPEGVGPVVLGDALEGTIAGVGTIALTIGPAE